MDATVRTGVETGTAVIEAKTRLAARRKKQIKAAGFRLAQWSVIAVWVWAILAGIGVMATTKSWTEVMLVTAVFIVGFLVAVGFLIGSFLVSAFLFSKFQEKADQLGRELNSRGW